MTPICPHSLAARPLIFPDDATLEIKNICQREKMLYLTVDGRTNCELYRGETVRIVRSPLKTRLVRLRSYGFYDRLRAKMAVIQQGQSPGNRLHGGSGLPAEGAALQNSKV